MHTLQIPMAVSGNTKFLIYQFLCIMELVHSGNVVNAWADNVLAFGSRIILPLTDTTLPSCTKTL